MILSIRRLKKHEIVIRKNYDDDIIAIITPNIKYVNNATIVFRCLRKKETYVTFENNTHMVANTKRD